MKATAATFIVVCLLLAGTFALAQMSTKAQVNVPFEFVAGDTTFPAGDYMFSSDTITLKVTNLTTNQSAVIFTRDLVRTSGKPNSTVVFLRDKNGRHVLHQFWNIGDDHGHDAVHEIAIEDVE